MTEAPKTAACAHTPTPWFVSGVRFRMNGGEWQSVNRYNESKKQDDNIACVGYDPRTGAGLADAHFIVEAVNSYARLRASNEEMRKALEDARTNICGFNIHNSEQYPETLALFNSEVQRMDKIIRDALAKVTYER